MNEIETPITETETPITEATTPVPTGRYAPRDASGSFASGEEQTPDKDAEERVHPGDFADTTPTA